MSLRSPDKKVPVEQVRTTIPLMEKSTRFVRQLKKGRKTLWKTIDRRICRAFGSDLLP
jgi:hypothetical protein